MASELEVAKLVVRIVGDTKDAQRAMKQAARTTDLAERETRDYARALELVQKEHNQLLQSIEQTGKSTDRFSRKTGRAAQVITQAGFAAEDFLTVVGTTGLAGGLRAAGNNLSFMASMLNPMAGLVVGVGAALGGILASSLTKATDETDEFAKSLKDLRREALLTQNDIEHAFRDLTLEMPEVETAFDLPKDRFQQQRSAFEKQIATLEGDAAEARDRMSILLNTAVEPLRDVEDPRAVGLQKELDKMLAVAPGEFQKALDTAIDTGNIDEMKQFFDRFENFGKQLQTFDPDTKLEDLLPADFVNLQQDVLGLTKDMILAQAETDNLNTSVEQLGKNEAVSKGLVEPLKRGIDAVKSVFTEGAKQKKAFDVQQQKEMQRAGQIIKQAQTPLQQFKEQFDELNALKGKGLIDEGTFDRSVKRIEDQFAQLTKPETKQITISTSTVRQAGAGTAEAIARAQQQMDRMQVPTSAAVAGPQALLEQQRQRTPVEAPRPDKDPATRSTDKLTDVMERLVGMLDGNPSVLSSIGLD